MSGCLVYIRMCIFKYDVCVCVCVYSFEPRPSSPRFYLAALEKNREVRPGTISHVMRAADDV